MILHIPSKNGPKMILFLPKYDVGGKRSKYKKTVLRDDVAS